VNIYPLPLRTLRDKNLHVNEIRDGALDNSATVFPSVSRQLRRTNRGPRSEVQLENIYLRAFCARGQCGRQPRPDKYNLYAFTNSAGKRGGSGNVDGDRGEARFCLASFG